MSESKCFYCACYIRTPLLLSEGLCELNDEPTNYMGSCKQFKERKRKLKVMDEEEYEKFKEMDNE